MSSAQIFCKKYLAQRANVMVLVSLSMPILNTVSVSWRSSKLYCPLKSLSSMLSDLDSSSGK